MSVDELVAALDERHRHGGWDVYRAFDGKWVARIKSATCSSQSGATIAEALQALLDYTPLPVVPKMPVPVHRSGFTTCKSGALWRLSYQGSDVGGFPTKRAANAAADRLVQRSIEEGENWSRTYGPIVATGTAGVHYRWAE